MYGGSNGNPATSSMKERTKPGQTDEAYTRLLLERQTPGTMSFASGVERKAIYTLIPQARQKQQEWRKMKGLIK